MNSNHRPDQPQTVWGALAELLFIAFVLAALSAGIWALTGLIGGAIR